VTPAEKIEGIRAAVKIAKLRLGLLDDWKKQGLLSQAQKYERLMTIDCIQRGERLLGIAPQPEEKKERT
jgi:hypothetical protein